MIRNRTNRGLEAFGVFYEHTGCSARHMVVKIIDVYVQNKLHRPSVCCVHLYGKYYGSIPRANGMYEKRSGSMRLVLAIGAFGRFAVFF